MKEIVLCFFKTDCFKDNVRPAHWVGHPKLRSLDIYDFLKRAHIFDENQASVTRNTEEEENASEETNDNTDENIEANDKNKDKVVTIEE